jgi:aldehyde dehydrogenase (NAD+)
MSAIDEFPDIATKVEAVRKGFAAGAVHSLADRKGQLAALRSMLVDHEGTLTEALRQDLGKSAIEAYTTEIGFTVNEIDHTLKHLAAWAKPRRVSVPLHLRPGSARVHPEPLGTVLIIAPWNYPVQLVLAPLVAAVAAGNTAVVKPSEVSAASADALARLLPEYLDESVVQVVTGAVPETTALLEQRWDHIFYTGNGTVGRVVMEAASKHLTPVTLELGGKSPAIVTANANLEVAARRIAWGKWTNAGQTCVAPDYVLVDRTVASRLITELSTAITAFYGEDASTSGDYGRIVSDRHFDRVVGLLDGAGTVAHGGTYDPGQRFISPTVITDVDPAAAIMQEEIFGPLLPIIAYDQLDEAIAFVGSRDKPLALYAFTDDAAEADRLVLGTTAGGVTVNHTLLHLAVPELPFGGVGPSGIGAYHGQSGFDTFSHLKPVLARRATPDPGLAYPPYTGWKAKLIRKLF